MAVVLFAWELGSGNGHLGRMLPVASGLAALGHRPVFVVRHLKEVSLLPECDEFQILQAPCWQQRFSPNERPFAAGTYADLLARHGYGSQADLDCLLRGWESLIELVNPALIVADHAPTACLAAWQRVPVALLGDGFTIPPCTGQVFHTINAAASSLVPQSRVYDVIKAVQKRRGRSVPESLPEMFATESRVLTTFPELDPYRSVRESEECLGPLSTWSAPTPSPQTPRVFVYLSSEYPHVDLLLESFTQAGVACSVYFRDGLPADVHRLREKAIEVFDRPQNLEEILPRVSAVVHHASLNMSMAALVAGRPQLVLPRHLEQDLTARALEDLGTGRILGGRLTLGQIGQSLSELAQSPETAERSYRLATTLHARRSHGCLDHIVQGCHQLI
jgi:rhamnosyltransferase subunit B